ncbi:MAG TPA: hypothetical protein VNK46_13080 [Nitrospiraceae bacterium]|jgi:hypothetical protein|nr:hypothetical protein [Nitrospiraceae bacterium]
MCGVRNGGGQAGATERPRQGPGIIVLSSSLSLLHKNHRAEELAAVLAAKEAAPSSDILPASLRRVCDTLLKSLSRGHAAPAWIQVSKTCGAAEPVRSVLIRGFGLRGTPQTQSTRIVIVLEER